MPVFLYHQNQLCQLPAGSVEVANLAGQSQAVFCTLFPGSSASRSDTTATVYILDENGYCQWQNRGIWHTGRELALQFDIPDDVQWGAYARILHLARWILDHPYCSRCGAAFNLPMQPATPLVFRTCPQCAATDYPPLAPCVIGLITREDHILLARHLRSSQPVYTLIAGFVEPGESIEQAFAREAMEECGIRIAAPGYAGTQPWPFPGQLMFGLEACYAGGEIVPDPAELVDAQFFSVDRLPLLPAKGTISRYLIDRYCHKRRGRLV